MRTLLTIMIILLPYCCHAQGERYDRDNPRFTDNIGVPMGFPLNPMGKFTNFGFGTDIGAGYNFTRRHAVIGEFMWNWLYSTSGALEPVRAAAQSQDISGHGNLFVLTADYRYEVRGSVFGTYFIGGGGFYHRTAEISTQLPAGITCVNPLSTWWGYNCSPGTTTNGHTLASTGSSAPGVNGGIGFTIRVGEAPYRFYVESRYHYAPTKNINTQLISVTIGFRY